MKLFGKSPRAQAENMTELREPVLYLAPAGPLTLPGRMALPELGERITMLVEFEVTEVSLTKMLDGAGRESARLTPLGISQPVIGGAALWEDKDDNSQVVYRDKRGGTYAPGR